MRGLPLGDFVSFVVRVSQIDLQAGFTLPAFRRTDFDYLSLFPPRLTVAMAALWAVP